ncbi:MAG: S24/S26 family peptidase [Butyricicoccus sp.]|nr:S24/S26 family peptidase [Butyricicoccus sp.]
MADRIPKEQFLRENGYLFIHPVGKSMLPLIRGGLDTVALAPPDELRAGDVVWYRREDGSEVLHRVLRVEGDTLDLCGDNQIWVERGVKRAQVLGVMRGFYRSERYIDTKSAGYRLYVRVWRHLLLRRVILKALRTLGKV